jgi:hypothetical protein
MARNPREFLGDSFGRKDVVDVAGNDRTSRHAVILRRGVVLRKSYAAMRLNFGHPQRSIRSRPRQDAANGAVSLLFGERTHEVVSGHVHRARLFARAEV